MKHFDFAKNLIGEGTLVQDFKEIGQELSIGEPLISESVTKIP